MSIGINAVFATPMHCLSQFSGGQQLYTRELLSTLSLAGIRSHILPLPFASGIYKRACRRLLKRPYRHQYPGDTATRIANQVIETSAQCLLLNGVTFLELVTELRGRLPDTPIVLLSHGLESTDYVHQLRARGCDGGPSRILRREQLKLGRQLTTECLSLAELDAVLALSEVESDIHRWLGATNSFWMPRAVSPQPIEWNPVKNRVGFVGTLDHPPNHEAIHLILRTLAARRHDVVVRIVGGPKEIGNALQSRYPCVQYLGNPGDESLQAEAGSWRAFLHPLFCFARGASMKLAVGLNWGLPIVATTAGCRGYAWQSGRLLEANTPDEFVDETCRLASDDNYMNLVRAQTLEVANSSPTTEDNSKLLRNHLNRILEKSPMTRSQSKPHHQAGVTERWRSAE